MFKVLIADDDYEDRELLKREIKRALGTMEKDLRFYEAVSVGEAIKHLDSQYFDLLTLDIQFDRMNAGIDALPDLFESYPTLNIIVISGRLNKSEVTEQLFRFTKDNVLKGKRWSRHFDVIDKKDDKTEALQNAYSFALKGTEVAGNLRDLFLLAESYMEQGLVDKCLDIYKKIQSLSPGEHESKENINIFRESISLSQALKHIEKGDNISGSLLMGYFLETRLKAFTKKVLGSSFSSLNVCLNELRDSDMITPFEEKVFYDLVRLRNLAIHHPSKIKKRDFSKADSKLKLLEE